MSRVKQLVVATVVAILMVVGALAPGWADDHVPGELVVRFADDPEISPSGGGYATTAAELDDIFDLYELTYARRLISSQSELQNTYYLRFPLGENLDEIIDDLLELKNVLFAEKNWLMRADSPPNDYHFTHDSSGDGKLDQWTYYKMQSNRAWEITQGATSVVAAIIDTGLDWQHPDLNANVWINVEEDINHNGVFDNAAQGAGGDLDGVDNDNNQFVDDVVGWDFNDFDGNPYPTDAGSNHGTNMSSLVSAETNNAIGIAGGTWHTRIMPIKIASAENFSAFYAAEAVDYAVANGAHVVNMSFSGETPRQALHDAIVDGHGAGVIFVASAGDDNYQIARYPGSWTEVIRVAAVDSSLYKTITSNYATDVDICAPSAPSGDAERGNMACAHDPTAQAEENGDDPPHVYRFTQLATSGGAAQVTAAVALLKARYPNASANFIRSELYRGAVDLPDPLFGQGKLGAGMVNPYRSLTQWGTISANTTWGTPGQATTVYVSGDVTVAAGYTLTIVPGTTIKIAKQDNEHAGADVDLIEINVEGALVANGTAAAPIRFEAWNPESSEDWVGFYFDSGSGGAVIDNCIIRHAEYGIESYISLTVTNTVFQDCRYAGIVGQDGTLLVQGCVMTDPAPTWGIYLAAADATVRNTVIDNATSAAIHLQANATLALRNSTLRYSDKGVYSNTSYVTVDSTCILANNIIGIHCYGSSPSVSRSSLDHNSVDGVMCDNGGSPAIQYCTFTDNYVGVYCLGSTAAPVLRRNSFSNNTGAGECRRRGEPGHWRCHFGVRLQHV